MPLTSLSEDKPIFIKPKRCLFKPVLKLEALIKGSQVLTRSPLIEKV